MSDEELRRLEREAASDLAARARLVAAWGRLGLGWQGERLPDRVRRAEREGVYVLDGPVALELVHVPAGEFFMGEEERVERIDRPFWIARTTVTRAQYREGVRAVGLLEPRAPAWARDDKPVTNVSFREVGVFCSWAGLDLPHEKEWERAARGTDGRTYPWGEEPPDSTLCTWEAHPLYNRGPAPADALERGASPVGAIQMAGNVWEYCLEEYAREPGWVEMERRVARGGAYLSPETFLTTYHRHWSSPGGAPAVGFRPVLRG